MRAALASAAFLGFGLAAACAQTTETAQISTNPRVAAANPAAVMPIDAAPAAPANAAAPAGPVPVRTAQGQQPQIAAPPAVPSAEACDDACVRAAADFAAQACVPLIEAKAAIDYDWLSRPFGGMFTQAEKPGADGIIRYRGDSIRILTQNQWLRFAYECAFDPVQRKIVSVEVRPGRLVPPAEVAQAAGAPVGQPAPQPAPQRQAQAAPQAAKPQPVTAAKPRPHFGEPSPISITQAHLRSGQVDTLTRIFQVPLGGKSRTHREPVGPR
jgi:hypothetical protein